MSARSTAPAGPRVDAETPAPSQRASWTPSDAIDQTASLLAFQARVLGEAEQPRTPLLERVKFLAIVGRNLDEFVMVRSKHWTDGAGEHARQTMAGLSRRAASMYHGDLVPALAREGVVLVDERTLTADERRAVDVAFDRQIAPHAQILWADDGRIGPSVPGLGLTLAVELTDATGLDRLAFLHLPDRPSSLVTFTPDPSRGAHVHRSDAVGVMWAADVVLARLPRLLPGCTIRATHIFRLVREGDLVVSANETQPLAERVIDATRRDRKSTRLNSSHT